MYHLGQAASAASDGSSCHQTMKSESFTAQDAAATGAPDLCVIHDRVCQPCSGFASGPLSALTPEQSAGSSQPPCATSTILEDVSRVGNDTASRRAKRYVSNALPRDESDALNRLRSRIIASGEARPHPFDAPEPNTRSNPTPVTAFEWQRSGEHAPTVIGLRNWASARRPIESGDPVGAPIASAGRGDIVVQRVLGMPRTY